jgi:hypothetical protein
MDALFLRPFGTFLVSFGLIGATAVYAAVIAGLL